MRGWLWIPSAAIVGLVAGSWGPREDLKRLEANAQESQTTRKVSTAAGFDAFARLANIPDRATRRKSTPVPNPVVTNAAPAKAESDTMDRPRHPRLKDISNEDLRARIDEAAELWRTRVELATAQWKVKLGVSSGDGAAAFDSAVATMNDQLRETMQAMADEIERTGKMSPELGLRLMGDASRVMAETYDAIGSALPEDRRDEVSELPVFEFIDPSVAEPMIGVQDKIGDVDFGGRRR